MLGWVMTYPFNMLSRCPVLSIPSGKASNNGPAGLQLVGPTYEDITVFQAASAFESAVGSLFAKSNYPSLEGKVVATRMNGEFTLTIQKFLLVGWAASCRGEVTLQA